MMEGIDYQIDSGWFNLFKGSFCADSKRADVEGGVMLLLHPEPFELAISGARNCQAH